MFDQIDILQALSFVPVLGIFFSVGAGSAGILSSVISGAGAVGAFAGGVSNLIKSFDGSSGFPQATPARISPAKGVFEQQAIEFLADIYQQVFAQLGFTYNRQGQLTYTPSVMTQFQHAQAASLAQRDEMRALGMKVPTYGTEVSLEDLTAQYHELTRRREALAQSIMGGTPVPTIAPGSAPPLLQPTEIGPFADPDIEPALPPLVDPNDPANQLSIDPTLLRNIRGA